MTTGTEIIEGEVVAEAAIDMAVTPAAVEVEAAVQVLGETVEETDMIMRGVGGVDLMEVLPLHVVAGVLEGAPLLVVHLHQGEEVLMGIITRNALLL